MTSDEHEQKNVREAINEETVKLLTDLRLQGKTMRDIAKDTGISLGTVGKLLKGVEPGTNEKANKPEQRGPSYVPVMISKEHSAKLYALAIDEGYASVEEFLEKSMLPWYRVKRDFEWKLRIQIVPKQFQLYIEKAMADSLELTTLKERFQEAANQPKQQSGLAAIQGGARN